MRKLNDSDCEFPVDVIVGALVDDAGFTFPLLQILGVDFQNALDEVLALKVFLSALTLFS